MNSSYTIFWKKQNMRAENRSGVAGRLEVGEEVYWKRHEKNFLRWWRYFICWLRWWYKFVKIHKTVYLRRTNFTVYNLYLSKSDFFKKKGFILALSLPETLSKLLSFMFFSPKNEGPVIPNCSHPPTVKSYYWIIEAFSVSSLFFLEFLKLYLC